MNILWFTLSFLLILGLVVLAFRYLRFGIYVISIVGYEECETIWAGYTKPGCLRAYRKWVLQAYRWEALQKSWLEHALQEHDCDSMYKLPVKVVYEQPSYHLPNELGIYSHNAIDPKAYKAYCFVYNKEKKRHEEVSVWKI